MVLACMVHYGDRLCAGSEIVGISNFVSFLENTQDYRRDLRRVVCASFVVLLCFTVFVLRVVISGVR